MKALKGFVDEAQGLTLDIEASDDLKWPIDLRDGYSGKTIAERHPYGRSGFEWGDASQARWIKPTQLCRDAIDEAIARVTDDLARGDWERKSPAASSWSTW